MKEPKPVDFLQIISYSIEFHCPYPDCESSLTDEREGIEYQSGEVVQCPYCCRMIELGEEL